MFLNILLHFIFMCVGTCVCGAHLEVREWHGGAVLAYHMCPRD